MKRRRTRSSTPSSPQTRSRDGWSANANTAETPPGLVPSGVSVGGGDFGIRCFAIQPPRAPGGKDRLLGPYECLAVLGIPDERAAAGRFVRHQIDAERVLPDLYRFFPPHALHQGAHDLFARGVPQRVHNAAMAMPSLLGERDLAVFQVEVRAVGDQLANVLGRLADNHIDDFRVAKSFAGGIRPGR